jgi:hypothetical protein
MGDLRDGGFSYLLNLPGQRTIPADEHRNSRLVLPQFKAALC